jgi:hypothetical protein
MLRSAGGGLSGLCQARSRRGRSADISNAVLYLLSEHGRFVTDTTHVVEADGGL